MPPRYIRVAGHSNGRIKLSVAWSSAVHRYRGRTFNAGNQLDENGAFATNISLLEELLVADNS